MAQITLDGVSRTFADGTEAVKRRQPRDRRRRVHDPRRSVGVREVDAAADDRRARGRHRGVRADRRPRTSPASTPGPEPRHGVPELRAVSAPDRPPEHGVPAQAEEDAEVRDARNGSNKAADLLELDELLDRKPAQLSGGQRQRVAMGRALVREPAAFLMDEPLSNLDAKLRVQMRGEIADLQDRLHTTTVYVTHDQTEALTLGDRVAVLRKGVLQQVAPPKELYLHPGNLFVAGFIGSPAMNFFPASVSRARGAAADGGVRAARLVARTLDLPDRDVDRGDPARALRGRRASMLEGDEREGARFAATRRPARVARLRAVRPLRRREGARHGRGRACRTWPTSSRTPASATPSTRR